MTEKNGDTGQGPNLKSRLHAWWEGYDVSGR